MTSTSFKPLTTPEQHRQQFPALDNKAYFNYGGQGVLSRVAWDAIHHAYEQGQHLGPFSGKANAWAVEEVRATRQAMATALNVPANTLAITEDVTVGCNIALWGREWQPGDRLVMSDCEHPGIVATVRELQRRFGIEIVICPLLETLNQGDPVAAIASHLNAKTRLVVISHILWNTGQVLPLADIVSACRDNGAQTQVLVDAAQSVGMMPLNLTELGADFYAFTGHKWWCGPEGVGGLYVRPEALETLSPTFIGWRGIAMDGSGSPTGWKPDSLRYEIATSAYPLFAGLRQAIALHDRFAPPGDRFQRLVSLSQHLWRQLNELPDIAPLKTSPPESGLVSFQLSQSQRDRGATHAQLVKFLEERHVMVRTILDPDCVRACVHYFTLESDIERLLEALQAFLDMP